MSTLQTYPSAEASRTEHLDRFLAVVNLVEPDHPHGDPWPITADDVDYGYHQSNSAVWASCGPRNAPWASYAVGYSIDLETYNSWHCERELSVITHELTHITVGRHSHDAMHPPAFWDTMAFYGQLVCDNFREIQDAWEIDLDLEEYKDRLIHDPNTYTVDRRYESVDDVQDRIEQWLRTYTPDYRN